MQSKEEAISHSIAKSKNKIKSSQQIEYLKGFFTSNVEITKVSNAYFSIAILT